MILTSHISHSSKNAEIKCPKPRKKLATHCKFCLMDADAKRPGRLNADTCGQGGEWVKDWQNIVDVFYAWPGAPYTLYNINYILSLGQFFAIKSKIKTIVFLINLKAKKVFFKVLSRFKTFFWSKNQFLGLKNQLLGLKSQINNRQGDFC